MHLLLICLCAVYYTLLLRLTKNAHLFMSKNVVNVFLHYICIYLSLCAQTRKNRKDRKTQRIEIFGCRKTLCLTDSSWCMHCFRSYSSFDFISGMRCCFKPQPNSLMSVSDASLRLSTKTLPFFVFSFSFSVFFLFSRSRLSCKTSQALQESVKKPLSAKLACCKTISKVYFRPLISRQNPPSVTSDETGSIRRVVLK